MNNPFQIAQMMMGNNPNFNNPLIKNAMDMAQRGDEKGLEQIARNLCNEKHIDLEKMMSEVKSRFGF